MKPASDNDVIQCLRGRGGKSALLPVHSLPAVELGGRKELLAEDWNIQVGQTRDVGP